MNNISRIQKIVLINWKGMFYQMFDLDHGMTILEGANGTGKTTIMIGAYVCLMPDLNFLSFQNVTTASTQRNEDKGLYGRLGSGEKGKDELVFSILDVLTANGERHLIGVQLIKKTYPQITLKHFAIKNLDKNAVLERLLIKYTEATKEQEILELDAIGRNCLPHGGELVHFRHAKEYFQFLFDNGISPVRLLENDERKQYNQLLNTSLYGGLSRSLQSSLRDYLLPENNKLITGIRDMEQNLLSCRRTRSEIQRNQAVRDVIHNIYKTGLEMFSNAFYAARLNGEQLVQKALESRREKHLAQRQWDELASKLASNRLKIEETENQLKQKGQELETTRILLEKQDSAFKIATELKSRSIEREKQKEVEQQIAERFRNLKKQVDDLRHKERELTTEQKGLASKMADASAAWEDLSKQVALFHNVQSQLAESRRLMNSDEITEGTLETWQQKAESSFEKNRQTNVKAYENWKQAQRDQDQFQRFHKILEQLLDRKIEPDAADDEATQAIQYYSDLKSRIVEAEKIPSAINVIKDKIDKRQGLKVKLSGIDLGEVNSADAFEKCWQDLNDTRKGLEEAQGKTREMINAIQRELAAIDPKIQSIASELENWETFHDLKKQLEDRTAKPLQQEKELSYLRSHLENQLQSMNLDKYQLENRRKELQNRFNLMINEETTVPGLKTLAKEGYGMLLADRYEDIPIEWAANLESRLGPLVNALVVKNINTAADDLVKCYERPDELWLVEEDKMEKMSEAREVMDSILVSHGDAWRLTKLSQYPILGKKARNQNIETLRLEIEQITVTIEKKSKNIKSVQKSMSMLNRILPLVGYLDAASPLERLNALKKRKPELEEDLEKQTASANNLAEKLNRLNHQIDTLRDCSIHQELLDETGLEAEKNRLEKELNEIRQQQEVFKQKGNLLNELKMGVDCLQQVPAANLDELYQIHREAEETEGKYRAAVKNLASLIQNRDHFKYADREALLTEKQSLNKHLKADLDNVEAQQKETEIRLDKLSAELVAVEESKITESENLSSLNGKIELLEGNLAELGLDGSEEAMANAQKSFDKAVEDKQQIEGIRDRLKSTGYQLEADVKQIQENKEKSQARLKKQLAVLKPVLKEWRAFRQQAKADDKLERFLAEFYAIEKIRFARPDVFRRKVSAARATLIGRMEKIEDTRPVLDRIKSSEPENMDDLDQAEDCLFIWRQIHGYLHQVIPVDLQTRDPEKAQEAINRKLDSLSDNLVQQETRLRENVRTIPNHLNTEIRHQKSQIRQLNQNLENVKFGFLNSIRISIETQPKLKQFLDILPQQLDIFSDINGKNVSIESLMVELYEKEVSGKVRGDLLLDYRHYVRMDIEVKREGNTHFERVTSTNLSTGESIGVGVAVLIMVLMRWEKKSESLRPAEKRNSIRFLLLDESSRLDQKALHTLNEFCEELNLQLLIAAPSVERTLRGTTHHLTRGVFGDRGEEVIVRGRGFKSRLETVN